MAEEADALVPRLHHRTLKVKVVRLSLGLGEHKVSAARDGRPGRVPLIVRRRPVVEVDGLPAS